MSARIINLANRTALRAAEAQIADAITDIRAIRDREIRRLERETNRRRERIETHLQAIEDDVAWRLPSDSEVQFS